MLTAALMLAAAATPTPSCHRPVRGEVVLQRGAVRLVDGEEVLDAQVAAIAVKSRKHGESFGVSQVDLHVWGDDCRILYRQTFGAATMVRFEVAALGDQRLLHAVAFYPGGSGHGFRHALLKLTAFAGELQALAPTPLDHGNMGGFFIGRLDEKRGDGIALWDADWTDGAHYQPHPADMIVYRWTGGGFVGPERLRTAGKVAAEPDAAPRALGFAFKDSSGQSGFEPVLEGLGAAPTGP